LVYTSNHHIQKKLTTVEMIFIARCKLGRYQVGITYYKNFMKFEAQMMVPSKLFYKSWY